MCEVIFPQTLVIRRQKYKKYSKFPKYSDTQKNVVITLKFELCGSTIRVMNPNYADGMANSVDPDQTAPLIWVCTVCPSISVRKLRIVTVPSLQKQLVISTFLFFCIDNDSQKCTFEQKRNSQAFIFALASKMVCPQL